MTGIIQTPTGSGGGGGEGRDAGLVRGVKGGAMLHLR